MKLFIAILLILFGGFFIGLTDDALGKIGNIIMHTLGIVFIIGGIIIARSKKGKKQAY